MIDQSFKVRANSVDLLALIAQATELKRVNEKWYCGPCPFCGGRDRFVLKHMQDGWRWYCRGCGDGKYQDAIAYVMRRDKVGFLEACRRLGAEDSFFDRQPEPVRRKPKPKESSLPPSGWQGKARQIIEACEADLWTDAGAKARAWLNARGLKDDTLRRWRVGYNKTSREISGLWVERGIVIPCVVDGAICYVKIRRPDGEPKYKKVSGSKAGLFGAETLIDHEIAVLCEGEFDCMLLHQQAGDLAGVATLGSASDRLDVAAWARYLLPIARFLVAYDVDGKSERGVESLKTLSARMRRVFVPKLRSDDKDITDCWRAGGSLRDWIAFEMARDDFKNVVEDPQKIHEKILFEIVNAVQSHERHSGYTWAEMLCAVQSQHPELALRYHQTYEAADGDIYGKWKAGALTKKDWKEFKNALAIWKQATIDVLDAHNLLTENRAIAQADETVAFKSA